ncbi:MAG: Xaa-Pro peptidase family protein [Chloroflexota bacterium]|nr:Xaa-Pro peptidase family protein [Chloroflexota bacterium]
MSDDQPQAGRIERVRAAMRTAGIDALYLNYGSDFQYVTGLEEPMTYIVGRQHGDWITGLMLPLEGTPILILRPSWLREYESGLPFEVLAMPDGADPDAFLAESVTEMGLDGKTIGVPKMLWSETLLSLQRALPNARFLPLGDRLVDKIREVKDADEIAALEACARITDAAFSAVVSQMHSGMLDRDLVIEIDYQLKKHGGDGYSFMPAVVLDGHGTRWAKTWIDREEPKPIVTGMTVAFDLGVQYRGYTSDFGRSVFIGEPNDEPLRAWGSITKAIQSAMGVMGDGKITPAGIHDVVVESVSADGFRDQFSWYALGHSIGLDVHENPWMLPEFTEPIRAGMCFALEPKIGRPGSFYVRCEDVCVVEQERARSLTKYPYDTIVIE